MHKGNNAVTKYQPVYKQFTQVHKQYTVCTMYSHISRKIYDKILPEKLGGDLSPVIEWRNLFQVPKYAISNVPVTNNQYLQLFIASHVLT